MPPTLSPSSRVRSRTSDISDFLRGRHDAKTSSDIQLPPPVPHLPEPVTPPKNRSKFAFLGRKRKPSYSPSSAKTGVGAIATAAAAVASPSGGRRDHASEGPSQPHGGNQPPAAGPSGRTPSRDLPPLPPLDIIAPGYRPRSETRSSLAASPTKGQYASPSNVLLNMRKQKGSFESNRRSTDSRSSMRPIITVSPPHNAMHEAADAYTAPRSAPGPPSPQRPSESSLPTPTASDMSDRTATPETPTSADIPSPSTSTHSIAQLPSMFPPDPALASATSFKEESLLRKDHFEIGGSESQPRRGTVSFNSSNPTPPATVGFSPTRQERRHISVLQLNRLKKEITATAPKIRKMPSDPKSLAAQTSSPRDSSGLARSNTVAASSPRSSHSPQSSRAPTPQQQQRRVPPPLKRTWHAPPSTGPPKEPLPSPPASAARSAQTPTTADSFRTARSPSPSPSPVSPRRTLPPLVLPREAAYTQTQIPSRAQGAKSPDSLASMSIPPSPSRTATGSDVETDRDAPSASRAHPQTQTPSHTQPHTQPQTQTQTQTQHIREDPALYVLGDAHATPEQLREALRLQHEKYTRLSAYLLSLTERHALEKAEMMRRVEALEADAARCEEEVKGLRWLVANGGREKLEDASARPGAARADSSTLPQPQPQPQPPASASGSLRKTPTHKLLRDRSASIRSAAGSDGLGARMSFDSPAGSVEEGLVELQTTISEFIAPPAASPQPQTQPQLKTRARRSNTVPNPSSGVPQFPVADAGAVPSRLGQTTPSKQVQMQRVARRTSSPVIPGPSSSSVAASPSSSSPTPIKRARAGLGLGLSEASPSLSFSRSPSPGADSHRDSRDRDRDRDRDVHARSDSSTLSSLPSLSTIHSSSSAGSVSGLSSIPETPRSSVMGDGRFGFQGQGQGLGRGSSESLNPSPSPSPGRRLSTSSVSTSPSIGQVLDRTKAGAKERERERAGSAHVKTGSRGQQPEMDEILRRLRAFGTGAGGSP